MYDFCDQAMMINKAWQLDLEMKDENKCENFHGKLMRFYTLCGQYSAKLANGLTLLSFDDSKLYVWKDTTKRFVVDLKLDQKIQKPEDYC